MTTSISSVNAGSAAASEAVGKKTSTLSDSTKAELEALGIEETDGMTEAQAQVLIAQAQQQQTSQDQGGSQDSESDILAEAKTLAASVGVAVSDDDDTDEILNAIADELEGMLEEAENNPAVLSQLSSYLSQLTGLDERYDYLESSMASMYAAMEMVSTNNKIAHGLE